MSNSCFNCGYVEKLHSRRPDTEMFCSNLDSEKCFCWVTSEDTCPCWVKHSNSTMYYNKWVEGRKRAREWAD